MANLVFDKAREGFATGTLSWTGDTVKAILVDLADYTFSAAHDFLNDVPSGARVATSGALTGKTATNGVCNASPTSLGSVTGDISEAIIIFKDTGTESTSALIAYIDSAGDTLPITPNGGEITINWDTGANKIFKL